jgi:hypothetical protein
MTLSQGTGITGISDYLKLTLIPSLTTLRVTNIYDNELTDMGGFPSATITVSDLKGKFLDNTRNQRNYQFTIRIFIDRNKMNFGSSKAETILRTLADEFISKVDADPTLGGNCIYLMVSPAKFGYINRENQNIRLMEVTIEAIDAVTWR